MSKVCICSCVKYKLEKGMCSFYTTLKYIYTGPLNRTIKSFSICTCFPKSKVSFIGFIEVYSNKFVINVLFRKLTTLQIGSEILQKVPVVVLLYYIIL